MRGQTIVIVDDEDKLRENLIDLLRGEEYHPIERSRPSTMATSFGLPVWERNSRFKWKISG